MTSLPLQVLVVCTANQCRSPMGEVIGAAALSRSGVSSIVRSAGTDALPGIEATDNAQRTATRLGLDLSEHRSQPVDAELVSWADVTVVMERRHLLSLVGDHGAPLATTFTLLELAKLATASAARRPDEPTNDWLRRIAGGRDGTTALRGQEIADPIGRSMRRYRATAELLVEAFEQIATRYADHSAVAPS